MTLDQRLVFAGDSLQGGGVVWWNPVTLRWDLIGGIPPPPNIEMTLDQRLVFAGDSLQGGGVVWWIPVTLRWDLIGGIPPPPLLLNKPHFFTYLLSFRLK